MQIFCRITTFLSKNQKKTQFVALFAYFFPFLLHQMALNPCMFDKSEKIRLFILSYYGTTTCHLSLKQSPCTPCFVASSITFAHLISFVGGTSLTPLTMVLMSDNTVSCSVVRFMKFFSLSWFRLMSKLIFS